jgi:uncharacterized RDD family membrane protein YckC
MARVSDNTSPPPTPQWPVPPTGSAGQQSPSPGSPAEAPPPGWQPYPQPGQPPGWQPYPRPGQPVGWQPPPRPVAPNGQPLATFLDRFLAVLIDSAIAVGVSLIWTLPFTIWWMTYFFSHMRDVMGPYDPYDPYAPDPSLQFNEMLRLYIPFLIFSGISFLLSALYTYLYHVEYQYRRGGQTVGKRVMKIRVIPVNPEAQATRVDFVKRWAVQFIAANLIPFLGLLDGLWQLWDKPLQQCLHDKAAATVVVKVG